MNERKQEEVEIEYNDADMYVSEWIDQLVEGEMEKELERGQLVVLLEAHGADFANLSKEEREKFSSKHYSNPSRSSAMKAVWGDRYTKYRQWCDEFVKDYESRTGKKLPEVTFKETGHTSKTEGMKGFFGDLTAFAATNDSEFPYEELMKRSEARVKNGILREQGEKGMRIEITIKDYNKGKDGKEIAFAPASFPPEFPQKAIKFIRSWE